MCNGDQYTLLPRMAINRGLGLEGALFRRLYAPAYIDIEDVILRSRGRSRLAGEVPDAEGDQEDEHDDDEDVREGCVVIHRKLIKEKAAMEAALSSRKCSSVSVRTR